MQKKNEQNGDKRCSSAEKINGEKPCTVKPKSSKQDKSTVNDFIQAHGQVVMSRCRCIFSSGNA